MRGRAVYGARCYFCHGYSGDARTVAAKYLAPPPRDFTRTENLSPSRIERAVREGRAGTAMKPFKDLLDDADIRAVAAFVHESFVRCARRNTRYHTAQNGWPDHERRYGAAFPFVTGALAVDASPALLTPDERAGRALFLATCSVCHEGSRVQELPMALDTGTARTARPPGVVDQARNEDEGERLAGHDEDHDEEEAEEYEREYGTGEPSEHDIAPVLHDATPQEKRGGEIYARACALCHAADGSGRNWIGSFLRPHPPDLRTPEVAARLDEARLRTVIRQGLRETSMPAFSSVLTPAEIEAVAAYVRRAFFAPAR
ncbi:MAG: cytochrome c [Alphaproteobacteria bacterium]|nr:MAG: cytochrome c [Alphaproteobacteria bacterium]